MAGDTGTPTPQGFWQEEVLVASTPRGPLTQGTRPASLVPKPHHQKRAASSLTSHALYFDLPFCTTKRTASCLTMSVFKTFSHKKTANIQKRERTSTVSARYP